MSANTETASAADQPENYLIAGDPNEPATWFFRIRNKAGELDFKLIDKARAKIRKGFHAEVLPAEFAAWAFRTLREFYDRADTNTKNHHENEHATLSHLQPR